MNRPGTHDAVDRSFYDAITFADSIEHDTLLYFSFQKDLENVATGTLFPCEEIIFAMTGMMALQ